MTIKIIDKDTGYQMVCRVVGDHYCGYVRVGKEHKWYKMYYAAIRVLEEHEGEEAWMTWVRLENEKRRTEFNNKGIRYETEYINTPEHKIEVHGGITYSGFLDGDDKDWYFGFDCAHWNDYVPFLDKFRKEIDKDINAGEEWKKEEEIELNHWNPDMVIDECKKLAKQLKENER